MSDEKIIEDIRELLNKGQKAMSSGNDSLALLSFKRALEESKKLENQKQRIVASTHNWLGNIYLRMDKLDKAMEEFFLAININKEIYGNLNHIDIARDMNNICNILQAANMTDKAMDLFKEVKKIITSLKRSGNQHIRDIEDTLYNTLGLIFHRKGEYDKAIKYYTQSIRTSKKIYKTENHYKIAVTCCNIGYTYFEKKDYEKSIKYLLKAESIFKNIRHSDINYAYSHLSKVYKEMGNEDKAEYYKKQISIFPFDIDFDDF